MENNGKKIQQCQFIISSPSSIEIGLSLGNKLVGFSIILITKIFNACHMKFYY